jgi:hypothetical protein
MVVSPTQAQQELIATQLDPLESGQHLNEDLPLVSEVTSNQESNMSPGNQDVSADSITDSSVSSNYVSNSSAPSLDITVNASTGTQEESTTPQISSETQPQSPASQSLTEIDRSQTVSKATEVQTPAEGPTVPASTTPKTSVPTHRTTQSAPKAPSTSANSDSAGAISAANQGSEATTASKVATDKSESSIQAENEIISSVWVANLLSTPSQAEADAAWTRLKGHDNGNQLYRYEVEIDGTNQHRLRLGFFPERSAAEAAATDMAKKAGLGTPWLVQPNLSEVRKYDQPRVSNLWAVNISSTPDQTESDSIWTALNQGTAIETLKSLESKKAPGQSNLSLYRYVTLVEDQKQYRIRLGFFETNTQAESAGRELAKSASLGQARIGLPWAVKPIQSEVEAYKK